LSTVTSAIKIDSGHSVMIISVKKVFLLILIAVVIFVYANFFSHIFHNLRITVIIPYIINIIWGFTIIVVITVLLLENQSPSKTLSWILILVFLPIAGFVLYLLFGRNYRKRKLYSAKERSDQRELRALSKVQLDENRSYFEGTDHKIVQQITKLFENNNKAFLSFNNDVEILTDGVETFSHLTKAISDADFSIHLQFFVIENDNTGKKLQELLIKKAREGVSVRVLYDAVGCWRLNRKYIDPLKRAGVTIAPFSPVEFPSINSRLNFRNHRKIGVIDGKIGFVGGVNIADKYLHLSKYYGYWRDTHLQITGKAVHSLQALFFADWAFCTGEHLFTKEHFPEVTTEAYNPVQIVSSGPDSNWESIMQGYFAMISLALKNINIVTPYLILNESILTAIKVAALSGIDIKIVVPKKPDHLLVFWGSRSYFEELIQAGVKIYIYQKGFIHSKIMTIDGMVSSIGTANMDIRSFTQNFEVNAFIYSYELTKRLDEVIAEDLQNSKMITWDELQNKPIHSRIAESTARLFSPLL
jgi:cardiolipin synthase A/B